MTCKLHKSEEHFKITATTKFKHTVSKELENCLLKINGKSKSKLIKLNYKVSAHNQETRKLLTVMIKSVQN